MVQEGVDLSLPASLLPSPLKPGVYAVLGPQNLIPWALETLTRTVSPQPVVWIDAANRFNAHWVSISARAVYKDPVEVLRSFHVARPFTAYQLEAMVTQKLLSAVRRYGALFSVIADPLSLYEGAEGRDSQVHHSFRRFIQGVREVARVSPLALLIPEPGPKRYFKNLLDTATTFSRLESDAGFGVRSAGEGSLLLKKAFLLPHPASHIPH
jgi:hypothetical protein